MAVGFDFAFDLAFHLGWAAALPSGLLWECVHFFPKGRVPVVAPWLQGRFILSGVALPLDAPEPGVFDHPKRAISSFMAGRCAQPQVTILPHSPLMWQNLQGIFDFCAAVRS
jgi:hypothetical protein